MFQALSKLIVALPYIVNIIVKVMAFMREAETKAQVKEDGKVISDAFATGNFDELNKLRDPNGSSGEPKL